MRYLVAASGFSESPLISASGRVASSDAKRAGLLAATRRMTLFLMAGLPIFVVGAIVL
jgi:hypothetical protein